MYGSCELPPNLNPGETLKCIDTLECIIIVSVPFRMQSVERQLRRLCTLLHIMIRLHVFKIGQLLCHTEERCKRDSVLQSLACLQSSME